MTARTVEIRCIDGEFPTDVRTGALAVIDVIRATTTAITAAAQELRCFPVRSIAEAERLAEELDNPVLAGEIGGIQPQGFDINNSPTAVLQLPPVGRPLILLSTGGTVLMREATAVGPVELASLRNVTSVVDRLARRGEDVLLLARTTRGEFREEDQLCAARIAGGLRLLGLEASGETSRLIDHWGGVPIDELAGSASVAYLRRSGQIADWDFIRTHIDDLGEGFVLLDREVQRDR